MAVDSTPKEKMEISSRRHGTLLLRDINTLLTSREAQYGLAPWKLPLMTHRVIPDFILVGDSGQRVSDAAKRSRCCWSNPEWSDMVSVVQPNPLLGGWLDHNKTGFLRKRGKKLEDEPVVGRGEEERGEGRK